MNDWTIIFRSLTGRMFATVTTVITVSVAVALMLVLLMMRDSGRKAFERGSGNMHLIVSADPSPLTTVLEGIFYAGIPGRAIPWTKYREIAASFPLDYAVPTQIGDSYRGQPVLATTPEFFTKFQPVPGEPWVFTQGRAFEREWEVVLGSQAARVCGLKLGEKIALTHGSGSSREGGAHAGHVHNEFLYTVVGILGPTGSAHDRALFANLNSAWIIHAFDRRERAAGAEAAHAGDHDEPPMSVADITDADRMITGIYLRLITREGSDTPANLPQIFDMLRRDTSVTVAQPRQQIDNLLKIVGNIDQILLGMAAVVMVSSGIAVMLALYHSTQQRRRQIAVLRVLGASRARIFGLILTESAVLGVLGAALGIFLAVVAARVVAAVMYERVGLVIEPTFSSRVVLMVSAGTVLLAAAAGLVPAVMAYRTPVANNLKPIG